MSFIFHQILGPLVLDWAPNNFVLGAQLAPGQKRLVCIPAHAPGINDKSMSITQYTHYSYSEEKLVLFLVSRKVDLQAHYNQETALFVLLTWSRYTIVILMSV